jgi:hypothetical protein
MELEPKKLMFCLMTAVHEHDRLADDLLKLHDLLEDSGELSEGSFKMLKKETDRLLKDFEEFKGSGIGEDAESRETLVKCFVTYMWILRIHTTIERYAPLLSVMEGIVEFSKAIDETNKFQESNI